MTGLILTQPMPWMLFSVAVWTAAMALIVICLVVFVPPLVRALAAWSREAFGASRVPPPIVIVRPSSRRPVAHVTDEERRRQLLTLVQIGSRGHRVH